MVEIVNVCCALHNICKHFAVTFEEDIVIDNIDVDEDPSEQDNDDVIAATVRDNIAQSLHPNSS